MTEAEIREVAYREFPPTFAQGVDILAGARGGFISGYKAGMRDPDAQKELLDECESLLIYIEKFPNEVTEDVEEIASKISHKLRAVRGGK